MAQWNGTAPASPKVWPGLGSIQPMTTDVSEWPLVELPVHLVSSLFVPLAVCFVVSTVFNERFLLDEKTAKHSLYQHAWQSLSGVSVWLWCCLFLNSHREEPDLTALEVARNLILHIFMSDAFFYWNHRACHFACTYFIHAQHHTHKATKGAEHKLNALSGTCVSFWDMVIIGHLPIFLPCCVVSLPMSVMICYVLCSNFWISMIHSVGTRIKYANALSFITYGLCVTPADHTRHHMYGRKNVNFGVFFNIWDRIMDTYEPTPDSEKME